VSRLKAKAGGTEVMRSTISQAVGFLGGRGSVMVGEVFDVGEISQIGFFF